MTPSRRDLIAGLGALGTLAALGPRAWAAQDRIILGEGRHKYEWVPGWAKLPEGRTFAPTHGCVQVDSKDRVYVNTDNAEAAVHVFEKDGSYVKSWGKDIAGGSAHGMCIVKEGDKEVAWVAHTGRHKVYKASLDGEVLLTLPWPQEAGSYAAENDYQPTMVAVAPSGDVYIAAGYGKPNNFIHQYDKDGKYVRSWNGSKDTAEKPLNNVHGVWIDSRGKDPLVMAVDRGNGRLVNYTLEGKFVEIVAKGLPAPCKAYIQNGDVLVPNLGGGIAILDKRNRLHTYIGSNDSDKFRGNFNTETKDFKDGQFTAPHGACWDSEGNLYVEDWNKFGRISKLKRLKA